MTDRGIIWSSGKHGDSMIVARDGVLTLVIYYLGRLRCITPIILYFILCLCIKFKGVE
jgi:hypothetical protein